MRPTNRNASHKAQRKQREKPNQQPRHGNGEKWVVFRCLTKGIEANDDDHGRLPASVDKSTKTNRLERDFPAANQVKVGC